MNLKLPNLSSLGTKTMSYKRYLELSKPNYVYIQITPHKSIRNYNSSNIAKAISHTYRSLSRRIRKEQKKIWIETNFKISYMIDIERNNSSFYFIIPKVFKNILVEKIKEIWSKAEVKEVENIKPFSEKSTVYQLNYKKEDALSVACDKKSNEPLNSIMSVIDIMQDTDRVSIVYNFLPRRQFGWLDQYTETIEKIKKNKPIEKEKLSPTYITKTVLNFVVSVLDDVIGVLNDFTGNVAESKNSNESLAEIVCTMFETRKELSISTKRKKELDVIDTEMLVISSSSDSVREDNNAIAVCQSFRVLDEDNELVYKKLNIKKSLNIEDYRLTNANTNTISTDEAQNFIQIPADSLLKEYGINHVKVSENPVPKKLQSGKKTLGKVKYKDEEFDAFIEDDYNIGNLALVSIGSQGSGKTTFMKNFSKDCSNDDESIIVLDFIKNCELSDDIKSSIKDKSKVIEIDLGQESGIQGLGYNEIKIDKNMSPYEKVKYANMQSQQLMSLIDAIVVGDPLSSRMRRFLNASANVTFTLGYSSVRDVIKCLENFNFRHKIINEIDENLVEYLEDEVLVLNELNEYSKPDKDGNVSLIGTKSSKIEHILDRIAMLKEDFQLKYMYNMDCNNNINLVDCMDQGKVVLLKMRDGDFPTKMAKNILVTYWVSKIWLASQLRGNLHERPKRCNVLIDEVFQAPTCMKILEYILGQARKFGTKFVFSCQALKQIDKIFEILEASGSSYMLLKGSTERDFSYLKNKLDGFEYEDLRDMAKFHSMNLIYYSDGYSSFISKLPKFIKSA